MPQPAMLPNDSTSVQHEGWTLHSVGEVPSTNTAARHLPPWHALRAQTQTAGRGRTGRAWISDDGGLWLSAVLPCPGERTRWAILPLATGWAIVGALKELGVSDLRLRWPNDIMVGRRKLAGLLVERYDSESAVVGIGLNVFNTPEAAAPDLAGIPARLSDLLAACPAPDELAPLVLRSLTRAHGLIFDNQFGHIAAELNRHWTEPRLVAVTLSEPGTTFTGLFHGIDETGRLLLSTQTRGRCVYDAAQVALLRELE